MKHEVIRGVIAVQPCDACDFGAGTMQLLFIITQFQMITN